MDSLHIEREYSAHKNSTKRPYGEYVKLEIFSTVPKYSQGYVREDNSLQGGTNATKTSWKSIACFKSTDKQNQMVFNVKYNVKEVGEYRVDLIYEQNKSIHQGKPNYNTDKDLLGHLKIGDVFDEDVLFDGENNTLKRITTFVNFNSTGSKTITVNVPHNCYFYGISVNKIVKFVGDNFYGENVGSEEGNMILTSCTVSNSDMLKPTELSAEVFYDPIFECADSSSGFYIDYRDECNFYVRTDDGSVQQIFGGYVSSVLPDSDNKKLSIHCADRLADGQSQYLLDQIRLSGGASDPNESAYKDSMTKNFDSYQKVLKYLCDVHEVTLLSNITNNYTVDGESFHDGFTITFGSDKKVKSITTSNGTATPSKNYILIRNNSDSSKKQVWTLYDASKYSKTPINITNYPYMHITYGLGDAKQSYTTKTTSKVDNSETSAGSQKFTKCGVSEDKNYLMAIGLPSAGKDSKKGWTKTIFKRKCPHCGSTNLIWDWNWGSGKACNGRYEGGSAEGHIFCISCDADYSVQGYEHINGSNYHMEKVSSTVSSSREEAQKLKNGNMSAVPSTAVTVTPDDVFKAITKLAFKYKYKLGGSSSYSAMKKSGNGDCWAFSELIFTELKKYGVSCKIVEYATNMSKQHRSVLYKDTNNKWVDFPYSKYGWDTKYENMLNSTKKSATGSTIQEYKGTNIGTVKVSTSNTESQTTSVTNTKGYDKDKPFQGYLRITYSVRNPSTEDVPNFKSKKYNVDVKFTYEPSSDNALHDSFDLYWVNNSIKKATLKISNNKNLVDYLRVIHGEDMEIYLQSIQMIAPQVSPKKKSDGTYEDTDWYKVDDSTNDNSSCKLNLYQITFDDNKGADPSDLQSCGKTVNAMMKEIVDATGYYVNMTYGLHRKDDKINFRVVNNTKVKYTATEGDTNNILSWNSISYSPIGNLYNVSLQVFKTEDNTYKYIETRDIQSVLKYGELCTLQTNNGISSEKEAYFNALQSDKYNPSQTYSFTITVPNCPNIQIGDLVKVVANAKKLNSLKEVKSLKISFNYDKSPRLRAEIGLDELDPDARLKKNIRDLRRNIKQESTVFDSTASPVTDEIYYEWDV